MTDDTTTNDTDREPVRQEPPGYPFPDEEIIYSSARNAPNFTLGEDSWFAVARMPETQKHVFNGCEHSNPYRFTIHSPVRGSTSMFVKRNDATVIIQAMLSVIADSDRDRDGGAARLYEDWYNRIISEEYDVQFVTDTEQE